MRTTTARSFIVPEDDEDRFLPEGPRLVTVDGREALAWVNIQTAADCPRGAIHVRFWDDGEEAMWNLTGRPGFLLATTRPGTLLVGMEKEIGTLDLETNAFTALARIPDDNPRTCINDGEVLPGGEGVVFGTKDTLFQEGLGHLYLFTAADSRITILAPGQICSNGKVIERDSRGNLVLLDIDSPTRIVTRYRLDVAARKIVPAGVALDLKSESAFPDGMCAAGVSSVIVAFYDPARRTHGRAVRYDLRTGAAMEEWTTPAAPRVTCPLLVKRPDGVKLILTTATEGMEPADFATAPNSGNLFLAATEFKEAQMDDPVRLKSR